MQCGVGAQPRARLCRGVHVEGGGLSEERRATPAGAAFQELVGRWAGTAVDFHREIVEDELFANAYAALGGAGAWPCQHSAQNR